MPVYPRHKSAMDIKATKWPRFPLAIVYDRPTAVVKTPFSPFTQTYHIRISAVGRFIRQEQNSLCVGNGSTQTAGAEDGRAWFH